MSHIHKKIDFTVEVFIVYKNKVLLRMHDKYKRWLSVGGHIELNENPIEAAIREVKEEVGLNIEIVGGKKGVGDGTQKNAGYMDLTPPRYLGEHKVNDIHKHIVLVYFAKTDNNRISESKIKHEQTEARWFTKKEFRQIDLSPNVLFYATEALKELEKNKL